jgi:hypothetical protein
MSAVDACRVYNKQTLQRQILSLAVSLSNVLNQEVIEASEMIIF